MMRVPHPEFVHVVELADIMEGAASTQACGADGILLKATDPESIELYTYAMRGLAVFRLVSIWPTADGRNDEHPWYASLSPTVDEVEKYVKFLLAKDDLCSSLTTWEAVASRLTDLLYFHSCTLSAVLKVRATGPHCVEARQTAPPPHILPHALRMAAHSGTRGRRSRTRRRCPGRRIPSWGPCPSARCASGSGTATPRLTSCSRSR